MAPKFTDEQTDGQTDRWSDTRQEVIDKHSLSLQLKSWAKNLVHYDVTICEGFWMVHFSFGDAVLAWRHEGTSKFHVWLDNWSIISGDKGQAQIYKYKVVYWQYIFKPYQGGNENRKFHIPWVVPLACPIRNIYEGLISWISFPTCHLVINQVDVSVALITEPKINGLIAEWNHKLSKEAFSDCARQGSEDIRMYVFFLGHLTLQSNCNILIRLD